VCGINDDNYYSTSYYIILLWLNIIWCTDTSSTLQYMCVWTVLHDGICIMCIINYGLNACIIHLNVMHFWIRTKSCWINGYHQLRTNKIHHDTSVMKWLLARTCCLHWAFGCLHFFKLLFCFVLYCIVLLLCSVFSCFLLAHVTSKTKYTHMIQSLNTSYALYKKKYL